MSAPSTTPERAIHNFNPAKASAAIGGRERAGPDRLNLARFQLFSNADLNVLEPLLSSCAVVGLVRGDVLIAANDSNNALYLVLDGQLRVQFNAGPDASIGVIEAGDCVGELSLIDRR